MLQSYKVAKLQSYKVDRLQSYKGTKLKVLKYIWNSIFVTKWVSDRVTCQIVEMHTHLQTKELIYWIPGIHEIYFW